MRRGEVCDGCSGVPSAVVVLVLVGASEVSYGVVRFQVVEECHDFVRSDFV